MRRTSNGGPIGGSLDVPPLRLLAGRSALYALAGALNKVLALITVPILTRLLTPDAYGLADLATGLSALLTLVALFGADIPAAQLAATRPSQHRPVYATYIALVSALAVAIALVVLVGAGQVAATMWGAAEQQLLAQWTAVLIAVTGMRGATVTVLRLAGRARAFAAISIVELIVDLVLSVVLVALGSGPLGVVQAYVVGNVVGLTISLASGRDLLGGKPRWDMASSLARKGAAYLPAGLAFVAADYGLRYLVANFSGLESAGHLATAIRIASVMGLATAGFTLAWGPYMASLPQGIRRARQAGFMISGYGGIALVAGALIALFGPEAVEVIAGSAFLPAAAALPGLLAAAAVAGATHVAVVATGLGGRLALVAGAVILGAAFEVVAGFLLLPAFGLAGIGMAAYLGNATALAIAIWSAGGGLVLDRRVVALAVVVTGVGVAVLAGMAEPRWLLARTMVAVVILAAGATAFSLRWPARAMSGRGADD
jgi:O-antigen/teichoic acid export membrane protein